MPEETQENPQEQLDDAQREPEQPADAVEPAEPVEAEAPDEQEEEGDGLPENQVDVEDAGTLKKKVTVTISRERIDAKLDEMYGELSETAQVPGFRIGRAPRRLIEKRFGRDVSQDVRNALIGESIGDALEKSELKTLGEPEIDLDEIELPDAGEMAFSFEVEIAPEFDLPKLKNIPVKKPAIAIDDARIDETLDQWRQGQAKFEITDDPAQADDMVQAHAVVTVEDAPGADVPGLSLRVAPGQIEGLPLVDLADALSGKKAGDGATLTVDVPESHPNEQWRGKKASVEVTLSQVRRQVLPEIDEEFAGGLGYDSLQQLRDDVKARLESTVDRDAKREMRSQVCEYLLEKTQFDLPEGVVTRHTESVLQRRMVELLQRGVPRNRIDENLTELQAAAGEQAERDLKLSFIIAQIGEAESIDVEDEEINARVAEMAAMYGRRPEKLRQELESDGSLQSVATSIREEKILDKLLDDAKVTEVAPEELAAEKAGEGDADKPKKSRKKAAKKAAKKTAKKAEKKSDKKSSAKKDEDK